MAARRSVKKQHERAVVRDFLKWLNARCKTHYEVIAEPDPPEAIIRSAEATRWVEVVDAFWSSEYARDINSYATHDETHKPINSGPYLNLDAQFAQRFVNTFANKLQKKSYLPCFTRYGSGYLIVSIQCPWFDATTVQEMTELWSSKQPWPDQGYLREVYIAFPSMNERAFRQWSV